MASPTVIRSSARSLAETDKIFYAAASGEDAGCRCHLTEQSPAGRAAHQGECRRPVIKSANH
jgi:hypothetical protein